MRSGSAVFISLVPKKVRQKDIDRSKAEEKRGSDDCYECKSTCRGVESLKIPRLMESSRSSGLSGGQSATKTERCASKDNTREGKRALIQRACDEQQEQWQHDPSVANVMTEGNRVEAALTATAATSTAK